MGHLTCDAGRPSGSLGGRHESAAGGAAKDDIMKNSYWLFGARLVVLAGHADTGGCCDFVEGWFPPGCQTPLHQHTRYAEQIYVLEGEFTIWPDGRQAVLRAGDDIVIPPGTPHSVHATGEGPARGLVVASPSGFARLITEAGTPDEGARVPLPAAPDRDLVLRASAELGDEFLNPPGALPD
jgi:quercetin dioxygenase-like cupin family protein